MIRFLLAVWLAATLGGPAAHAQGAEADDNRYQFSRVDDGYLRLDLKSGQVSMCGPRDAGWSCLPTADDRAAFESEIARLQRENAALKKSLLDRGLPLPASTAATTASGGDSAAASLGHADGQRAISVVARMWRRLVELMVGLRRS
jgi:hypothetical protein